MQPIQKASALQKRAGKKCEKTAALSPYETYAQSLSKTDAEELARFFRGFDMHCRLHAAGRRQMRKDFEAAILYYHAQNVPLDTVLKRLDTKFLGGFYARSSQLWFALDDAAKIYPISLEHGRMSLFRLAVYLRQEIVPELLQMALHFTIKRFPSFATTLKKGFFWHYLDTAKRRFCIEAEQDIPCQPLRVSVSGSQSFRVLYYQNRISVEFFHVLTDGVGGMCFLKVLTGEYLRLLGEEIHIDESMWDINATPSHEEFENAFARVQHSKQANGFIEKPAVQMNGRLSETKPCRVLHFKMDANVLKQTAQSHGCTVTVYLLALLFLAGKAATDELRGEMSIQVPVNMRKFFSSRTVRNFAMYCGIRLPIEADQDLAQLIDKIREQLAQKTSQECMVDMLTATERLVNTMKFVPLAVKQPVAKLVYGFLGDKVFSNTLSNLGLVKLPPSLAQHVLSMDFILGTAVLNRALCGLVTVNDTSTLSITKMTIDPSFEDRLYDLLSADGIDIKVEGSTLYED